MDWNTATAVCALVLVAGLVLRYCVITPIIQLTQGPPGDPMTALLQFMQQQMKTAADEKPTPDLEKGKTP